VRLSFGRQRGRPPSISSGFPPEVFVRVLLPGAPAFLLTAHSSGPFLKLLFSLVASSCFGTSPQLGGSTPPEGVFIKWIGSSRVLKDQVCVPLP